MANLVHLQFSKVVFGAFLGFSAFTFLNMYKPKYAAFYSFAKVKRL